jgi:hypothetical protein
MTDVPTVAGLDDISRDADPVTRNLRITLAYHELSTALGASMPDAANWCTFATWASRQAGQTIRREDLARAIEADLGGAEEIGDAVTRVSEFLRAVGRAADRSRIVAAIREVVSPVRAVERSSAAVAGGNKKVFDEIAYAFARFIDALAKGAEAGERFCAGLRPGAPPDGQDMLRAAFTGYRRALVASDPRAQSEETLLANLRIGLHEQTRLQPDILDALDAPIADPREVKRRLLQQLVPQGGALLALRAPRGRQTVLDDALQRLLDAVRRRVRRIVTEQFMTLDLPGGQVRLGSDLVGTCPAHLLDPLNPELKQLLRDVDPVATSTVGSGAEDWADLAQRMHFICELFRSRQHDGSLFGAPFTAEQVEAIREARRPDGRL